MPGRCPPIVPGLSDSAKLALRDAVVGAGQQAVEVAAGKTVTLLPAHVAFDVRTGQAFVFLGWSHRAYRYWDWHWFQDHGISLAGPSLDA